MAASFDGGVILAADSRTSTGTYVANRVTDKLTKLTDKIYICRSGSAADTQNITAYLRWFLAQHQMDVGDDVEVATAANLAMQMVYQNKVCRFAWVITTQQNLSLFTRTCSLLASSWLDGISTTVVRCLRCHWAARWSGRRFLLVRTRVPTAQPVTQLRRWFWLGLHLRLL